MTARPNTTGASAQNPTETIPLRNNDEHWRHIFEKYDKNGDGHICMRELDDLIHSPEYDNDIPQHVFAKIHKLADTNGDGRLDLSEFVEMIHHPDLQHLFGDLVNKYVHMLVPRRIPLPRTRGLARAKGQYEDEYSCCPPPVGMILISIIEIIFFCIDESEGSTVSATGPIATALIYDPRRRYEAWRYITYMFVHTGYMHLVVNLCVQVLLGTPLEMVHRWWRVLIIYFAGVSAGSLGISITDPSVKLAGAISGVYALMTAHIATIIMNWKEMEYPTIQLVIFLIITGSDLGAAIYDRYVLDINAHIGYAAHLAGAIAGLLVGINILKNIEVTRTERVIWWSSMITYVVLMGIAIIWNAAYADYFPPQDYRKL